MYHHIFLQWSGPAIYIDPKGADPYLQGEVRAKLQDIISKPAEKIIVRPVPGTDPHEFDEEVERILKWLVEWKRQYPAIQLLVVVDEAQRYCQKTRMSSSLDILVQTCAAMSISTCIINPDYSTVPRQLFFQADYVCFFTAHPVIIMYLQERLQSELSPEDIKHLEKKYHGLAYDWHNIYRIYPDGSIEESGGIEHDTDTTEDEVQDESEGDTDEPVGEAPDPGPANIPGDPKAGAHGNDHDSGAGGDAK